MKEFILIFRNAPSGDPVPSPEQLKNISKPWQDWMGSIAAQNKLANRGNRLGVEGATVLPGNVITDGPYAEVKEILGGYIVVKTSSLDEAVELAKGCPILNIGGNVEVRDIVQINV
jgi:hypothetical protein